MSWFHILELKLGSPVVLKEVEDEELRSIFSGSSRSKPFRRKICYNTDQTEQSVAPKKTRRMFQSCVLYEYPVLVVSSMEINKYYLVNKPLQAADNVRG